MVPTLKELKHHLFEDGLLAKLHRATEIYFVETLLPDEFTVPDWGFSASFCNYPGGHNPTRNKLFNGKADLGSVHKDRIIYMFSTNPEKWTAYVAKCGKLTSGPHCQHERLAEYLSSIFDDLKSAGLSEGLCSWLRDSCSNNQAQAIASAVIYSILGGDISFLDLVRQHCTSADSPSSFSYLDTVTVFLRSSVKPLLNADEAEFQRAWAEYSKMFETIATVSCDDPLDRSGLLLDRLYHLLTPDIPQQAIHVEGPSGSDKNALLQLLFLKIHRDNKKSPAHAVFVPFYISLNYFEKDATTQAISNESYSEMKRGFEHLFETHLHEFKRFCEQNPQLIPIIFIDGIRNYTLGIPLDALLSQYLKSVKNLHYVIGIDIGLPDDAPRRRNRAALLGAKYFCTVKLSSLYLYQKRTSLQFLEHFCNIYGFSSADLYDKLTGLPFYTVDAYQLRLMYPLLETSPATIGQLYDAYCERYFNGDTAQINYAAVAAYKFTYTADPISLTEYYTNRAWVLIRRHASFVDYFIAQHYVKNLLHSAQSKLELDAINIVFPKSITRFVTSQLNQDAKLETNLVSFIAKHYNRLGTRAKSEMTYWLGRIKHNRPRQQAIHLLNSLYQQSCPAHYSNRSYPVSQEIKEELFLHRGIAVSLIYMGDSNISNQYIQSLIEDPVAAEINCGFHLEYYGDIAYLPTIDSLSYSDDLQLGEKTLMQLFLICNSSITKRQFHPAFDLCLFTICSLIQARIGQNHIASSFDLRPHIEHMVKLLQFQIQRSHSSSEMVQQYFSMMLIDGTRILEQTESLYFPVQSTVYNFYSELKDTPRTGWVSNRIPNPENISTHMYNGWLMAFLLLPDVTTESDEYNKNDVMSMLLIHDLAERTTGDIERPIKNLDPAKYQQLENFAMASLLFKGTYPAMGSIQREYRLWKDWVSLRTYNAKVAKDIDCVQAIYQLCEYLLDYRDHFSEKKISSWILEYDSLRTDMGRWLFHILIQNNSKFKGLDLDQIISL